MRTLLATVTILAALTLTGTAQADPGRETLGPGALESAVSEVQSRSGTAGTTPPKASCKSRWCLRVKLTYRIAKRIDRALTRYGSPMAGHGLAITRAVRREGGNPFAVLAISGAESSFGKAACGYVTTGLGQCWRVWTRIELCGRTVNGPSYVTSWAAGLGLTARLIRCLWPRAQTVWDLTGYCSGCNRWSGDVEAIARQYFGSGPGVKWKDAVAAVR